ncbi:hypothetical protein NM208_g3655 [Fusarium decemcellulare]|uniref:Uncharacterized protein n=1 Tax=Fusarium decemcellulare TaxID=57161 RepID=A0ACC1SNG2_9HYPO|nr:hypothetical protein NM208_g3655 [Fusarium decemcellulare]
MGEGNKDWKARTLLIREICMLKFIEDITNKSDWWLKVRNPNISERWKEEVQGLNWAEYRRHGDFTVNMAEMCIQELRKKATLYEETDLVPVMDYSACVIKSDKVISDDVLQRLKAGVKSLEDIPDIDKDWHPGSDSKVLDLVHPSLFPLVYGRSSIMPHERIGLGECLDFCGRGVVIPEPDESDTGISRTFDWQGAPIESLSIMFQWLPCDVAISNNGQARIESYINNLHPEEHSDLYPVIEEFIQKSLPAWDLIYRWVRKHHVQRLTAGRVGRPFPTPDVVPKNEDLDSGEEYKDEWDQSDGLERLAQLAIEEPDHNEGGNVDKDDENDEDDESEDDDSRDYQNRSDAYDDDSEVDGEEDEIIESSPYFNVSSKNVKSSGFFNNAARVQVIVKLANIHLTPDKPSYDGGSWHIEGQLNEHICATALFYYDSSNITESRLAFRSPCDRENLAMRLGYRQGDYESIEKVFAVRNGSDTLQNVGSVLTRPGRAIFFPNLFQHKVQPFSLSDPTKPGYRKILALFLVDPAIPVISTSNIPPQQKHWAKNLDQSQATTDGTRNISSPMEMDEAKRFQEALMAERTVLQQNAEDELAKVEWSFCEH